MLPTSLPTIDGFRAAWRFLPCASLAGDSLNVLPLDERRVALYGLDVSGHGVSAALLSAALSHLMSAVPEQSCLFEPAAADPGALVPAPPARSPDEAVRLQLTVDVRGQVRGFVPPRGWLAAALFDL